MTDDKDTPRALRVGVVGFSRRDFDHRRARALLESGIEELIRRFAQPAQPIEIVSGLTRIGVPLLAYELARERGWQATGISAEQALTLSCGLFPVDQQFIEGKKFGDESAMFVDYIDCLVRIGGGQQSVKEVVMFRERCASIGIDSATRVVEHELDSSV